MAWRAKHIFNFPHSSSVPPQQRTSTRQRPPKQPDYSHLFLPSTMVGFEELPYEMRIMIANSLDRWPDLQSFRHCCRDNYFLLTDRPFLTGLQPLTKGETYFLGVIGLYIELPPADVEKLHKSRICAERHRYSHIREGVRRIGDRDTTGEPKIVRFCRLRNLKHALIMFGVTGKVDMFAFCAALWQFHFGWEGMCRGAKYEEMEEFMMGIIEGMRRARKEGMAS